jgi:ABC-type transport system substrate-binding protein
MPGQFWKYKNDELDRLIEQASTEIDIDKSYALYKKIHKRIYEEQPVCFLFFHENLFALSARFGGAESYFNINMATYTVKDWYLLDRN